MLKNTAGSRSWVDVFSGILHGSLQCIGVILYLFTGHTSGSTFIEAMGYYRVFLALDRDALPLRDPVYYALFIPCR